MYKKFCEQKHSAEIISTLYSHDERGILPVDCTSIEKNAVSISSFEKALLVDMLEKSCDDCALTCCCGGDLRLRNADVDVVHCNSIPTIRYEFISMVYVVCLLSSNWREKEGLLA